MGARRGSGGGCVAASSAGGGSRALHYRSIHPTDSNLGALRSGGTAAAVPQGTRVEGMITQLFEGFTLHYVQCINIDYSSTRPEQSFKDLQVRGASLRRRRPSTCHPLSATAVPTFAFHLACNPPCQLLLLLLPCSRPAAGRQGLQGHLRQLRQVHRGGGDGGRQPVRRGAARQAGKLSGGGQAMAQGVEGPACHQLWTPALAVLVPPAEPHASLPAFASHNHPPHCPPAAGRQEGHPV